MSAVPKPHLVVVDDEPQVLTAIEDQLDDTFVVHVATSGRRALAILEELKDTSVLLSDQRMPGMTGDELFARAAQISDATQVMITGFADLGAVIRAVNKGRIFGYVTKPWEREALRIMLHKAEEHHRLVRELKHERELLHNLMENVPDEIYFKALDHRYIRINRAAARGQGLAAPEAAIGRLDADLSSDPARVDAIHAEDRRVAASARPLTADEQRRGPDGATYWVSTTKAPVLDERGKVTSIVAIARDVTERKRMEDSLRENEAEIRLLHTASDAMAAAPDVKGALAAALATLCEASGWDYGEAWMMTGGALRVRAQWHAPSLALDAFVRASGERTLVPGRGLVGEVWRSAEPVWIPDLEAAEAHVRFQRHEEARAAGLCAALAVPVTGDDGLPRAVMLLFRRAVESGIERTARLATTVARQLGGAIERKQNAAQLAEREVLLRSVLDTLPVGVRVADREGLVVMENPAAERIWSAGRRGGGETRGWWADSGLALAPDDWPLAQAVKRGEAALERIIEIEQPDATRRVIASSGVPIRDQHGSLTGGLVVIEDITERRAQEKRIARLTRMHATLSGINTMIVRAKSREELFREACRVVVETGKFLFFHVWLAGAGRRRLALAAQAGIEIPGLRDIDLEAQAAQGRPSAADAYLGNRAVVINDLTTGDDGSPRRRAMIEQGCRSVVSLPLRREGQCVGVLGVGSAEAEHFDEEELRLLEELTGDVAFALETLEKSDRLYYLASHDPLTGLANRTRFVEQVAGLIPAPGEPGAPFALASVNLRRFRNVNESLGRHLGDELLKQVGARLAALAGRERVARLGADLFGVLLPEIRDAAEATRAAARLRKRLAPAFALGERQLHVDVRFGLALYPGDGANAEALCANAEAALKVTRGADDVVVFYKAELNARVAEQLDLENRLRLGLRERQFVLHWQPKVDATSGAIVGAEALIRWQDPKEGLVPPGRFIPMLEETGLIVEVGEWALEEAARMRERLHARGLDCPRIAVNISQVQMRRPDFPREVVAAVRRGAGDGRGVDLEITESLLAEDVNEAVRKLKALRREGFSIAVDDFGTGYSSLGYLARLPVDALKVDRSFVVKMTQDANAMAIVSTIINLAHSFRLKVVAEGVDAEDQFKLLRLLRCDEIQGFLFHKPMPEEEFAALLERGRKATAAPARP